MILLGIALFLMVLSFLTILVFKVLSQSNLQLNMMASQLNERLKEMSSVIQDTQKGVGERLDNASSVIGKIQNSLGKLEETNRQIYEISKDITSLQNLLRAPKFRGEIGETLLGNLLEQVLPKDYYEVQHQFKSGETVDAVMRIGSNIVPVDAKFPLENFQGFVNAVTNEEKNAYRKKFAADVKNRITEISVKYILPDEGTFDFALMYIPAENIYYEITIKEDLLSYALSKNVIPVSPNTFYAYLQVICLGLKGMQVERNAKEILANLSRMQQDLVKFSEDFRLVGTHIQNALRKYEEADKKLDRFQEKLVTSSSAPQAGVESLIQK